MKSHRSQSVRKMLTVENHLDPDPVTAMTIGGISSTGVVLPPSLGVFSGAIMGHGRLSPHVPDDIREQWEAAKASTLYGFYYYPLYALGCEQVLRVAESAFKRYFRDKHPDRGRKSFFEMARLLADDERVDNEGWKLLRLLRNEATHSDFQKRYSLGLVSGHLDAYAALVNELWAPRGAS